MNNSLTCFHTCSFTNENEEELKKLIPFCSNTSEPQWLGQGYYFWTDSDYFAHKWGKDHYNSTYAINKFEIEVPENLFFDLVGNVKHQMKFLEYKNSFHKLLDEILEQPISQKKKIQRKRKIDNLKQMGVTVSTIFWVLRYLRRIEYKVVKSYDIHPKAETIKYIKNEYISLPSRQQIVVYPEAKGMINHITWVYPD